MSAQFHLSLAIVAMTAIVVLRYALVSGGFAWLTSRYLPDLHKKQKLTIPYEIRWSLVGCLIYSVPAAIVIWGWQDREWTRIYTDVGVWPMWWIPASILVYLLLHDTWFYWTHRLFHRPRVFKLAHSVHHMSRPPSAWAAMSFHPLEALSGAIVIPLLVLTIPIHAGALLAVLTIMTVMGVTNHMGWELFPRSFVEGPAGRWLITASHHDQHHRHYRCNYGLYFRFWDKACGTDRGLVDLDRLPRDGRASRVGQPRHSDHGSAEPEGNCAHLHQPVEGSISPLQIEGSRSHPVGSSNCRTACDDLAVAPRDLRSVHNS